MGTSRTEGAAKLPPAVHRQRRCFSVGERVATKHAPISTCVPIARGIDFHFPGRVVLSPTPAPSFLPSFLPSGLLGGSGKERSGLPATILSSLEYLTGLPVSRPRRYVFIFSSARRTSSLRFSAISESFNGSNLESIESKFEVPRAAPTLVDGLRVAAGRFQFSPRKTQTTAATILQRTQPSNCRADLLIPIGTKASRKTELTSRKNSTSRGSVDPCRETRILRA